MKNLFFCLSLCLFATTALAQPSIEWEKSFGGTFDEKVAVIINTPDEGYLVGSETESNNGDVSGNHGTTDIWLTKINSNGIKQWQKCLGGLEFEAVNGIVNTSDGGYILAGNTLSNGAKNNSEVFGNRGDVDIWVVKLDENGAIQWRQCYGGCGRDEARAIRQTSDGNYVIVGGTLTNNSGEVFGVHGNWDAWVFKIAADGAFIWQKTIGGSGVDYLYGLQETQNGDLIVGGLTSSTDGDLNGSNNKGGEDYWIAKLSLNGDLLWNKTYGGSQKDGVRGICVASNGNIMVTGLTFSDNGDVTGAHGGSDAWVLGLNANGQLLWENAFGGSANETGFNVFERTDNDFILIGETNSFDGDVVGDHGGTDIWVVKFDKNGVLKSQICLGGSDYDYARAATRGNDNSVIVGGTSFSTDGDVSQNHGSADAWIVKLSVPLALKPEVPGVETLELKITPNPTSDLVQISTNVAGNKQLNLFDATGKLVQTLEMNEFEKSLKINALPAGIYLVRMTTQTGQVLKAQFVKA